MINLSGRFGTIFREHTLLYWILRKPVKVVYNIQKIKEIVDAETYYPELTRRKRLNRFYDLIAWLWKYDELNEFYNIYGLDTETRAKLRDAYCDYKSFMKLRNERNSIMGGQYSHTALLRDKYLFFKYMTEFGLPVPPLLAVYRNGQLLDLTFHPIEKSAIENKKEYFLKDIDGECASYVKLIHDYTEFDKEVANLQNKILILQEKIVQHQELNRLNPLAVNTLRLVTVRQGGSVKVMVSLLRVGNKNSGSVDNWAVGGISIAVKPNGYLEEWGFYKPGYGTKCKEHPDTGIRFSEYHVPYYREAVALACKAHEKFYGLNSIGWDVAITENGPIFIEGNDNWEISQAQACSGPLKKEWNEQ